jgi:hypothetical protein
MKTGRIEWGFYFIMGGNEKIFGRRTRVCRIFRRYRVVPDQSLLLYPQRQLVWEKRSWCRLDLRRGFGARRFLASSAGSVLRFSVFFFLWVDSLHTNSRRRSKRLPWLLVCWSAGHPVFHAEKHMNLSAGVILDNNFEELLYVQRFREDSPSLVGFPRFAKPVSAFLTKLLRLATNFQNVLKNRANIHNRQPCEWMRHISCLSFPD